MNYVNTIPHRKIRWLLTLSLLAACLGCMDSRQAELKTSYGKISRDPTSINGTSMLAEKLRQRGLTVRNRTRISPTINGYQTIVWMPDSRECPSESAVGALNEWLSDGYDRTLVYVGGDYSAQRDYLSQVYDATPVGSREEMLRLMAEQSLEEEPEFSFLWRYDNEECQWFELQYQPGKRSAELGGPWAANLPSSSRPALPFEVLLKPSDQPLLYESEVRPLLTVDDELFAYEIGTDNYWGGRVIVVANASFLLNYSLVDPDKEALADCLLDEIQDWGDDVLFLESGPEPIQVSDSDYENHNSWAWIAEAPLRYIVPHFLFWGMIFCFVFFPIFGRPRRTAKANTSSFQNHIKAMAKQLERSGRPIEAASRIQHYHELTGERKSRQRDGN